MLENSPANAGDPGSIPVWGRCSGEGNGNPLQYPCLEKSHEQRGLGGYIPWGHIRVGHDLATKQRLDTLPCYLIYFNYIQ